MRYLSLPTLAALISLLAVTAANAQWGAENYVGNGNSQPGAQSHWMGSGPVPQQYLPQFAPGQIHYPSGPVAHAYGPAMPQHTYNAQVANHTALGGPAQPDISESCGGCGNSGRPCFGRNCGMLSCGCGNALNPCGPCCPPRCIDGYLEFMFMFQGDAGRNVFYTSDGVGGPIILSNNDLQPDGAIGMRLGISRQLGGGVSLEGAYLFFNANSDDASVNGTNNLYSAFSNFGAGPLTAADEASSHYIGASSKVDSAEVHLRFPVETCGCRVHRSYLAGFRWFQVREDFRFVSTGGRGLLDYRVRTDNRLFGIQVGGDAWYCVGPQLRLGAGMKLGLYGNAGDQATTIVYTGGPVPNQTEEADLREIAFVMEINLDSVYQVTECLSLRLGYNFLVVDGIARAAENVNFAAPGAFGRNPTINLNGNAFYHGINLGAEWNY